MMPKSILLKYVQVDRRTSLRSLGTGSFYISIMYQNQQKQSTGIKFIPNFFRKETNTQDGKTLQGQNTNPKANSKDNTGNKKERMNRNLLISQRNLTVLTESNDVADELKYMQSVEYPFDSPGSRKQSLHSRDMVVDQNDSTRFDDLDDLYG